MFGSIRHHHQNRRIVDRVHGLVEQLTRGGIYPVDVLEDEQHRLAFGEAEKLIDEGGQRQRLVSLGRDLEGGIAVPGRNREKIGE